MRYTYPSCCGTANCGTTLNPRSCLRLDLGWSISLKKLRNIFTYGRVADATFRSLDKFLDSNNITQPEDTLPETNMAPENGWLEYYFPIGKAYFQGRTVSFREGKFLNQNRRLEG